MKPILLLLSLLGLFASCNSTPTGADAMLRVTLRQYAHAQMFELVSETHTDPKKYYSTLRGDANRKVLPDRSMDALVSGLRSAGMDKYEKPGPAPMASQGRAPNSFEIQRGASLTHWLPPSGSTKDAREEQQAFFVLLNDFLKIYNNTDSFQFVRNKKGGDLFEESKRKIGN